MKRHEIADLAIQTCLALATGAPLDDVLPNARRVALELAQRGMEKRAERAQYDAKRWRERNGNGAKHA